MAVGFFKMNHLHQLKDENANDTMPEPSKKKHKRGSGAANILTVFKLVDANDSSQGHICKPCT